MADRRNIMNQNPDSLICPTKCRVKKNTNYDKCTPKYGNNYYSYHAEYNGMAIASEIMPKSIDILWQ